MFAGLALYNFYSAFTKTVLSDGRQASFFVIRFVDGLLLLKQYATVTRITIINVTVKRKKSWRISRCRSLALL